MGEGLIAQKLRLLDPQIDDLGHDGLVVVLIVLIAADRVGSEELLPQIPILRIGQERQHAGFVGREKPGILELRPLCGAGGGFDHTGRQTGEIGLVLDHELEGVGLGEEIAVELHLESGQPLVDLLEPALILGSQKGAVADIIAVEILQQKELLGVEVERLALVIDGLHPGKEPGIELDLVLVGRQPRRDLLLNRFDLVVGVGSAQGEKDPRHLVEHLARAIERRNGVGEGRRLWIVDDCCDLGVLTGHSLLERRDEVGLVDAIEGLDVKRRVVRRQRTG